MSVYKEEHGPGGPNDFELLSLDPITVRGMPKDKVFIVESWGSLWEIWRIPSRTYYAGKYVDKRLQTSAQYWLVEYTDRTHVHRHQVRMLRHDWRKALAELAAIQKELLCKL